MPPGQSNQPGGILTFSTYIMPPWHFVYTKSQDAARHGIFRFFLQNWSQIWSFFTKCIFSGKFWRKMWTSWNIQFFQRLRAGCRVGQKIFTHENSKRIQNYAGVIPNHGVHSWRKVEAAYPRLRDQNRGGKIQIRAILRNPVFRLFSNLALPMIFYASWSLNSEVLAMSRDIAAFDGSRFR